jgi:PKD repeat protein
MKTLKHYSTLLVFTLLLACTSDDDDLKAPVEAPVADFVSTANADYSLEVEFRNTSQHALAYAWSFGDQETSTEETPTHTYAHGGTYTVTLIAKGSNAQADTLTRDVEIQAVDACAPRQLAKEVAAIDAYLAAEHITAQTDPSGLRYVIHKMGDGAKPTATSTIGVDYTASILFPNEGEQALLDQGNIRENLTALIRGWQVALPLFPQGTHATLYVPSCLAYGEEGRNSIAPYTSLTFYLELQEVK